MAYYFVIKYAECKYAKLGYGGKKHQYLALLLPVIDDVSTVCWRSFSDSECLTLDKVIIIQRYKQLTT